MSQHHHTSRLRPLVSRTTLSMEAFSFKVTICS